MLRTHHRALAAAIVSGAAIGAAASADVYTIEGIGALADLTDVAPTPPNSAALAINDAGQVGGSSWISGGFIMIDKMTMIVEPILTHAVTWQDGVLADIGIPGGDVPPNTFPRPSSYAKSINESGQSIGDADLVADGWYHPFLHLPAPAYGLPAGILELPKIAVQARAWAINDSGVVAGESRASPGTVGPIAVLWTPADGGVTITNLGAMGGVYSVALGINSPGQVTGWFSTPGPASQTHAFLYLPQPAYGLPAGGHDLSKLPGTSIGNDINDLGQIAGRGPGFTPMIWLPEPAYGLGAGMTHFPVETMFDQETLDAHGFLFTHSAQFNAIGGGIAVGYANFGFQDGLEILLTARAIAWIDGEFHMLQDLLLSGFGPDATWQDLVFAWDVNESRQVAGTGILAGSGEGRGYVASLRNPGDVDGDGLVSVNDLLALLAQWGPCSPPPAVCPPDLDGNGTVGIGDLLLLLSNWD